LSFNFSRYGAHPLTHPPGFNFCWAGARATHGAVSGKVGDCPYSYS